MDPTSPNAPATLASSYVALQHRPRPLALLLQLLRERAGDDAARVAAVLAGIRAYQRAERPPRPVPMPVVARVGRATLIDHGGSGPPVVFVPSLINGAEILDLDEARSPLRWLARRGLRPLLVDWGSPDDAERERTIAGHVEELLVPLLDALGEPPLLVGYCLGGTMALGAAALRRPRSVALIAAPWRFAGYGATRAMLATLWDEARPAAEALGLLPMEVLQAAFWRLDPVRTLDKFAAFGRVADDPMAVAKFVPVEDWANAGAPLTLGAARELAEGMFQDDATGAGRWRVGAVRVDPAALGCDLLEIVSLADRIVPAATTPHVGVQIPLGLGHVGMIVGGSARRQVWQPLADWLLAR